MQTISAPGFKRKSGQYAEEFGGLLKKQRNWVFYLVPYLERRGGEVTQDRILFFSVTSAGEKSVGSKNGPRLKSPKGEVIRPLPPSPSSRHRTLHSPPPRWEAKILILSSTVTTSKQWPTTSPYNEISKKIMLGGRKEKVTCIFSSKQRHNFIHQGYLGTWAPYLSVQQTTYSLQKRLKVPLL